MSFWSAKCLGSGNVFVHLTKGFKASGKGNTKGPERIQIKALWLHCAVQLEK